MADLVPAPFADLVRRVHIGLAAEGSIFHLPRSKWWTPDADGPDLSVELHGHRAGTPIGPAAGPHTQMAQNLVLGWLAGARIFEMKTVQINDQLEIPRPCIDAANVCYNIEWSQELRIGEALREYVAGAMLIHMLRSGGLLEDSPITTVATETLFDISVGYDLEGIRSAPVRRFIEQMGDASEIVERLRGEIPSEWSHLRDLDYATQLSSSITLSTFHGCPPDEIERICEFLITVMDCDVIIKMNPPMLGKDRLEHLLYEVLGYTNIRVPDSAYASCSTLDESVAICQRLTTLAAPRGRAVGAKFSNTLEVENHRDIFTADAKTQYLSGQPLHVITLALADAFRQAVGPEMPLSFSAGVDRLNAADVVAAGFCPVTVCTDLLRPGGYGRLPPYLTALSAAMKRVGATDIDAFIRRHNDSADAPATELWHGRPACDPTGETPVPQNPARAGSVGDAAARNLTAIAAKAAADPRYAAAKNSGVPKRLDSQLETFDCITCGKCLPVCPNAANFIYAIKPQTINFHDLVVIADHADQRPSSRAPTGSANRLPTELSPGEPRAIIIERPEQIANFADFCNDCGNCDTFCPEYGGPFIKKPSFFGSLASWQAADRDGFYIDASTPRHRMHGRVDGKLYFLEAPADNSGEGEGSVERTGTSRADDARSFRFEDGEVSMFLSPDDLTVARWEPFGPADATGHVIDMHAFHTMRILLTSLLDGRHVHQVNAAVVDLSPRRGDGK